MSNLKRFEAAAHSRRQTSRSIMTTMAAITMVAASRTGKFPVTEMQASSVLISKGGIQGDTAPRPDRR